MFEDTVILDTAWINQPKLAQRAPRTLLVGAALLTVRQRFAGWSFSVQSHATTITDNPALTMQWLAEHLGSPTRLLLWRGEDTAVPSLIAAAETSNDPVIAAKLLRQLDRALRGEVVDVAVRPDGPCATSFARAAHEHGLPWDELVAKDLAEAHRTSCQGRIRDHLTIKVTSTWRLWLESQADSTELKAATAAWVAEQGGEA